MKKLSKRFSYPRNRLCYGYGYGRSGVCSAKWHIHIE